MTPKERAAMQQALEALVVAEEFVDRHSEDWYISGQKDLKQIRETITALREALAEQECKAKYDERFERLEKFEQQATVSGGLCGGCAKKAADGWALYCVECWEKAEQEPVAWLWVCEHGSERLEWEQVEDDSKWKSKPLYAAPVRTKDLTDDEIVKVTGCEKNRPLWLTVSSIARAVIAADREKNRG